MTDPPTRPVVADHDPREHRARPDEDQTLCGRPVLIAIEHDGRLLPCPVCEQATQRGVR